MGDAQGGEEAPPAGGDQYLDKYSCLHLPALQSCGSFFADFNGKTIGQYGFFPPLGKGAFKELKQNKRGVETAAWVCFLPLFEIKCY